MNSLKNRRQWLPFFGLLCWVIGRALVASQSPTAFEVAAKCADAAPRDGHFARGTLDAGRDDAFMRQEWLGPFLGAAKAEPLGCGDHADTYRLLWQPSFRASYVIEAQDRGNQWTISATEFVDPRQLASGQGRLTVARRVDRALLEPERRELMRALDELSIWEAPQYKNSGADDGWAMVLEARAGRRYRALTRINFEDLRFAVAARVLMRLSGVEVPRDVNWIADGVGTAGVDPWANLKQKTAWIVLGGVDDHTNEWMTTLTFQTVPPQKKEDPPIPVPGQVIQVVSRARLYILGFAESGESRRFDSPADTPSDDRHQTGAALPVGALVTVQEISLSQRGLNLRMVFARVSPK